MKRVISSILLASILVLAACQREKKDLKTLAWMQGSWENRQTDNRKIYEKWTLLNDSALHGTQALSQNSVVLTAQTIDIWMARDTIFYKVSHNNTAQPQFEIYYGKPGGNGHSFDFENAAYSFPRSIHYESVNADSLVITSAGRVAGRYKKQISSFRRIKENKAE